jgi:hypothetical protein
VKHAAWSTRGRNGGRLYDGVSPGWTCERVIPQFEHYLLGHVKPRIFPPPELLVAKVHEKFDARLRLKDEGTSWVLVDLLSVQPVDRTGTSRVRGGAGASEESAGVALSEVRSRCRTHSDTRSPATASTSAFAACRHGAASGCGDLIGHVGAGRGGTARRNHRDGLTG